MQTKKTNVLNSSSVNYHPTSRGGFLNHPFPNGTCQPGSTDSSCPDDANDANDANERDAI